MEGTQTPPAEWSVPPTAGAAHARNSSSSSLNAHHDCCEARLLGRGRSVSRERERKSLRSSFLPSFRRRPFIIILAATSEERGAKLHEGFPLPTRINTQERAAGERPREAGLLVLVVLLYRPSSAPSPTELRGRAPRSSPTASIARPTRSPSPSPPSFLPFSWPHPLPFPSSSPLLPS